MTGQIFDFRSDTVTRPDAGMREAIFSAKVGDDVYRDDESVNQLERHVAQLLGKEAALFVSSGTQSNLIAIITHTQRGEEFITGQNYHSHFYEAGGAAVLGSVVPCALPVDERGALSLEDVKSAIKPNDPHYPISRLLCLENTVNGFIQNTEHLADLCIFAHEQGLKTHLDGARLMNAAVASNTEPQQMVRSFDSVSLCLSKGLGAPAGSLLAGPADFIEKARRWRKMLGGGMRQAGILAAAGIYALEHNTDRLAEDHEKASQLAWQLAEITHVDIQPEKVETNMVFMRLPEEKKDGFKAFMAEQNILISPPKAAFRLVLHKDISSDAIQLFAEKIRAYMAL